MQITYSAREADQNASANAIFTDSVIDNAISMMAADIREELKKYSGNILYVCIMDGGVPFFVKATAQLPLGYCAYLKASSYSGQHQGELVIGELSTDAMSRKYDAVIVFDDICDSGTTLQAVTHQLAVQFKNTPVYNAVLVWRLREDAILVPDFSAIPTSNPAFFYGCGMDADGFGRNANFITK